MMARFERFLQPILRLDEDETTGEVLHFKVLELYMVYHLIWTAWYWGLYTLRITDVVLPLGLAQYIDISLMHGNALPLVNAGAISILAVLACLRVVPRWTYLVVVVLMHFQYVARYSLGEISHGAHMTGMTILAFAVGMIVFDRSRERRRFIMGSVLFFVGVSYVSAGLCKIFGTGPWWIDGRHLWIWMAEKSVDILSREGAYATNLLQDLAWSSRLAATLILLSGLLIELGGFLLWYRKTRAFAATMIIGMHIGILFTMNIRFDASIAQVLIIGFPWYLLMDRALRERVGLERRARALVTRFT